MDRYQFNTLKTPCGVPIYINQLPWIEDWFCFEVLFHGGAWFDPEGKEGLAHFREHCGSRGTQKVLSFEDLTVIWDEVLAATFHASTYYEGLQFGGNVFKERIKQTIDVLREFIFFPRLDPEGIQLEKAVLNAELRAKFKNKPIEDLHRRRAQDIWGPEHPLARILSYAGTWDGLEKITREDLTRFGERFLHQGNLEMIFCGDISPELAFEVAAQFTEGIPTKARAERPPRLLESWRAPDPQDRREKMHEMYRMKSPVSYNSSIVTVRPLPHTGSSAAFYILAIMLREILFDIARIRYGRSYSPGIQASVGWTNRIIGFSLDVHPSHLDPILDEIRAALLKFDGKEYVDLFERKKGVIRDRNHFRSYNPEDVCNHAIYNIFYETERIPNLQEMIQDAESATYEQVQQIMLEEFNPHAHWTIIEP